MSYTRKNAQVVATTCSIFARGLLKTVSYTPYEPADEKSIMKTRLVGQNARKTRGVFPTSLVFILDFLSAGSCIGCISKGRQM